MRVVFAHIKKYKVLEDVVVNIDSAFSYEMLPSGEIQKRAKNIPANFFADNISMHCVIGKNGSGKSLLMNVLLGGADQLDADESYFLLYEAGQEYLLKKVSQNEKVYYLCDKNEGDLISIKSEGLPERFKRMYHARYLSSNNINMLKSDSFTKKSDWSIGNDKRFNSAHNAHEAYHYIRLKGSDTTLDKELLDRKVKLKIFFKWMVTEKPLFGLEKSITYNDIMGMVDEKNVVGIFYQILLRALAYSRKNKLLNEYALSDFGQGKDSKYLFALLSILRKDFGINDDAQFDEQQQRFVSLFLRRLRKGVVFHKDHLEINSDEKNDILIRVFSLLAVEYKIQNESYRFFITPVYSTGQWKRVELASKFNILKSSKHEAALNIFLDEPDADLHPELQTELIAWIIDELKTSKKQFNIVISTHNPLILSDFPAEAITSLSQPGEADVSQTFGANIYELYKKTFLVEHAMGKFAADKIRQALVSKKPDVALLTFLRDEIAEPLIVREINTVLASLVQHRAENDRLDDFFNALTPEQRLRLRDWMNNHDS